MNSQLFLKVKNWQLFLVWIVFGKLSSYNLFFGFIVIYGWYLWMLSIAFYGAKKLSLLEGLVRTVITSNFVIAFITPVYIYLSKTISIYETFELIIIVTFNIFFLSLVVVTGRIFYELKSKTNPNNFLEYLPYSILFFFFFIGVWVVQPEVNRIDFNSDGSVPN